MYYHGSPADSSSSTKLARPVVHQEPKLILLFCFFPTAFTPSQCCCHQRGNKPPPGLSSFTPESAHTLPAASKAPDLHPTDREGGNSHQPLRRRTPHTPPGRPPRQHASNRGCGWCALFAGHAGDRSCRRRGEADCPWNNRPRGKLPGMFRSCHTLSRCTMVVRTHMTCAYVLECRGKRVHVPWYVHL